MSEQYSEAARRVMYCARLEACQLGGPDIEPEHLLLGILRADMPLALRLFGSSEKMEAVREQLRKHFPAPRKIIPPNVDLPLSYACQRAVEYAAQEAERHEERQIAPQHLLIGLSREESSLAGRILRQHGITAAPIRQEAAESAAESGPPMITGCRDLVEAARRGEAVPLVGRERELERIIHILSRRTKNNPVLIGDAGVGKTAIVEGLARRIAEAQVPPMLGDRRLLALDASALTGSKQRSRYSVDWEAVVAGAGDAVLFIRGLFNLASAASVWAVVEAMHALEPPLAQGHVQVIATGSPGGLRETLDKAPMLARHFEVVNVAAVNEQDAIRIVSALKKQFERFHEVTISEEAIAVAVYASGRFLTGRHLPDRAIDLIDEAAAAVKLRREAEPREIAEVRKKIRQCARSMENAVANHQFEKARHYSDEEQRERANLERLRDQYKLGAQQTAVTPEEIQAAAAARAGVPIAAVERLLQEKQPELIERIAAELAGRLPVEAREWVPFLAAYLVRCSAEEAEALAQAIVAAKAPQPPPQAPQGLPSE